MTVDLVLQENGIYATLAGILGGFAFVALMQLIEMEKKGILFTTTTVLFALATFMFLLAFLAFVLTYAVVAETNRLFYDLGTLGAYALFDTYGAIFVLLAGIGMSGWIRSRAAGIATTVMALVFSCLSGTVLVYVFNVLASAAPVQ
ncbi:MAG: hypothetical protein HY781_02295 [Chloroflexi bacterium]|nr:hypothetical protein [Chloroflexota bacterium]